MKTRKKGKQTGVRLPVELARHITANAKAGHNYEAAVIRRVLSLGLQVYRARTGS